MGALSIAVVPNKTGPVTKTYPSVTWDRFASRLARVTVGEKDGPAWMPANIEPGPRSGDRVQGITALVLDVEAKTRTDPETDIKTVIGPEPPDVPEMVAELDLLGWHFILHTTHSHLDPEILPADARHPRYRLVLALSRPLQPDEVKPLGHHVASVLGISDCFDKGAVEPARLFYLPRVPEDRLGAFRFHQGNGEALDVDALLSQARRAEKALQAATKKRLGSRSGSVIEAFNQAYDVGQLLESDGYVPRGGKRWKYPESTTGQPGVRVLPNSDPPRVFSSHGGDPLNDGHAHDAFDVYRILKHDGDMTAAVREAAKLVGMDNPGSCQRSTPPPPQGDPNADPCDWTKKFTLSDEEIRKLRRPEWIIRDFVIRGHLIIVVAEPNGGKTTIFVCLAGEMVQAGYRVFYVNADISGSDAAKFIEAAKAGGWTALLPDLIPGMSMQDVIERLEQMNESGGDLTDVVFIFDTFKKMTDVINKTSVKALLKLMRSLTGKGMTIILLGHTNKYKDADGKPVYEGTGDVRADADELIYLIPQKHTDGSMTVSTDPNKVRGDFQPITFEIDKDLNVSRAASYVDTAAARAEAGQHQSDSPDIRVILDAIEAGKHKQTEIIEHCRAHRISKRTALRILSDYDHGRYQKWRPERAPEHNTVRYYAVTEAFDIL